MRRHFTGRAEKYALKITTLRLPWKQSNFVLTLKNRVCTENFHCIEHTFYIQDFWATCACPEKECALKFFTVLKYFLSFRIFEQLALALKTEFALKLFKRRGGAVASPLARLVRLCSYQYSNMQSQDWTESCEEVQTNIINSNQNVVKQKW